MSLQPREPDGRSYRSIREVLELLVPEYPDMTISKIRFLESRGLIEPERTPSGYRKFYEADVERLRWILRQQREHFLPLKVIKGRLEQGGLFAEDMSVEPSLFDDGGESIHAANETPQVPEPAGVVAKTGGGGGDEPPVPPPVAAKPLESPAVTSVSASTPVEPAKVPATPRVAPRAATESVTTPPVARPSRPGTAAERPRGRTKRGANAVTLSVEELVAATGATEQLIADLVEFGLIEARTVGGTQSFSDEAVETTKLAVGFGVYGLEPRHLRSLKNAADRQASTYIQVVAPLLRQKNPAARERAEAELDAMLALGSRLHDLFVEGALRNLM